MSSLIEQAILDAKDLKEAAVKNAEQMIIEKYAEEIKSNLEQLLEQDLGLGAAAPAMPAMPGTTTPAPLPVDPTKARADKDSIPDQLEYAAFDGMKIGKTKYPELNEEVEIDLTSLSEYELDPTKGPTKRNIKESIELSEKELMEMLDDMGSTSQYAHDYSIPEGMDDAEMPMYEEEDDLDLLSMLDSEDEEEDEEDMEDEASDEDDGLIAEYDDDMDLEMSSDEIEMEEPDSDTTLTGDEESDMGTEESDLEMSDLFGDEEEGDEEMSMEELEEAIHVDYNRNYKSGRDYGLGALTAEDTHTFQLSELSDQVEELEQENKKVKQQNESLKKQLSETAKVLLEANKQYSSMKDSFQKMKGKLAEVQLINTKLLYSNKVLADASLNERQKNRIVESLSNAETLEKVQIVYETLQSAVEENTSRAPKSLSEAVSRRSSPILLKAQRRDDRDANPINETLQRMKILAGINK
jgi:hypothetical protein